MSNEVESVAAAHARLIEQRWDGLETRVSSKLAQIAGLDRGREAQLLVQATNAKTATQRVHWLRKSAQAITGAVAPLAACRKGCSHCCSISVVISRAEATVIAKETGRTLSAAAGFEVDLESDEIERAREAMTQKYKGTPCVFLEAGQCQIYEHRPLACRLLLNLDEDDLLCQLVPDAEPPRVPYLNTRAHELRALLAFGNQQYDDIRAWFGD